MILPKATISSISISFSEIDKRASMFVHFSETCEHFYVYDPHEALAYFAELRKRIGTEMPEIFRKTPSEFKRKESNG